MCVCVRVCVCMCVRVCMCVCVCVCACPHGLLQNMLYSCLHFRKVVSINRVYIRLSNKHFHVRILGINLTQQQHEMYTINEKYTYVGVFYSFNDVLCETNFYTPTCRYICIYTCVYTLVCMMYKSFLKQDIIYPHILTDWQPSYITV